MIMVHLSNIDDCKFDSNEIGSFWGVSKGEFG